MQNVHCPFLPYPTHHTVPTQGLLATHAAKKAAYKEKSQAKAAAAAAGAGSGVASQ